MIDPRMGLPRKGQAGPRGMKFALVVSANVGTQSIEFFIKGPYGQYFVVPRRDSNIAVHEMARRVL